MEVDQLLEEVLREAWTFVLSHMEVPLVVVVVVLARTLAAVREMVTIRSEVQGLVYSAGMLAVSQSLPGCRSSCSCLLPSTVVQYLETDSDHDAAVVQRAVLEAVQIAEAAVLAFVVEAGSHHTDCLPKIDWEAHRGLLNVRELHHRRLRLFGVGSERNLLVEVESRPLLARASAEMQRKLFAQLEPVALFSWLVRCGFSRRLRQDMSRARGQDTSGPQTFCHERIQCRYIPGICRKVLPASSLQTFVAQCLGN